jgi:polysaccharide biosynthesis/export protein
MFLLSFTILLCVEENIKNTKAYEEQILEKKINEIVEKRLKEKGNNNEKDKALINIEEKNIKEENLKKEKKKIEISEKNQTNNNIELFGKKIFNSENSIDTPSEISAGKDYILSSGDVIKIVLWSENVPIGKDGIIEIKIAANGVIAIPDLGAFTLRGKSIEEAENEIKERGIRRLKDFKASISLVQMRSINIFVLGEVITPGNYNLSPMSGILSAIYKAGGITDNSSLRNIKILREGKTITIDLYDYLLKGEKNISIILTEGDTVFIPVTSKKVTLIGNIAKAGIYELNGKTTLKELIEMAGGATSNAFLKEINIKRKTSDKLEIVTTKDIDKFEIFPGDEIYVGGKDSRISNGVLIKGNVVRPGVYEIKSGETFNDILLKAGGFKQETYIEKIDLVRVKDDLSLIKNSFNGLHENPELIGEDTITVYSISDAVAKKAARIIGEVKKAGSYQIYENSRVSDLIFNAGGVNEETAYFGRADIIRIDENGIMKVIKIDIGKILAGNKESDIALENYDQLKIYSLKDTKISANIYIYGEVRDAKEYEYFEGMTISDAIFYAKGMKISADKSSVEIVRSSTEGYGISSISVNLNENPNFELKEFDQIFVRKIPNWEDKKIIKITGYVKYPGEYSISNNETLNELIKRAGGYKEGAFPEGAKFYRNHNFKEELAMLNIKFEEDMLMRNRVLVTNLDYDKSNKEFKQKVILKNGDKIDIPEIPNVVNVMGEVYMPGMVVYEKGKKMNYYVESSGGYKETAYKNKAFVVKYNGKTVKNGWLKRVKVEAGDTIIVPKDDRNKKSLWEVVGTTFDFIVKVATTYAVVHNVTK